MSAWVAEEALSRLAIARATELDDVTLKVYLDALADLAPDIVRQACLELAKQPRQPYDSALPSVGAIRAACADVVRLAALAEAQSRLLPMPARRDEPTFACLACLDTAWRLFDCAGGGASAQQTRAPKAGLSRVACGRPKSHGPHTYAEPCACAPTNPVVAASRRRQQEFVHAKQAARGSRSESRGM